MHIYCIENVPDICDGFVQRNKEVHNRNTKQSNDFHLRFARFDARKFSLRFHGATIWNGFFFAIYLNVFKQMIRKHLNDLNVHAFVTHFKKMSLIIGRLYYHFRLRYIICQKLVLVVQLLISHYRFGTLAAFMATAPATVSFGGEKIICHLRS